MAVVTISRETCSFGDEFAEELAKLMGCPVIKREDALERWLKPAAQDHQYQLLQESPKEYLHTSSTGRTFAELIEQGLTEQAARSSLVILGMGSQIIFRQWPDAVHVRVVASQEARRRQAMRMFGLSEKKADQMLRRSDRKHRRYVWEVFSEDWTDPCLYHLVINSDGISMEQGAQLLLHFMDLQKAAPRALAGAGANGKAEADKQPAFAHPSEKEFAQLLDRYHLRWEYEPTTFPMEWDAEGNVAMAFSPDFYLPEFDTYIELTTMKQTYAAIKKKKVRRLKELYPDVNIRMVYRRDFHALVERFGLAKGGAKA